MSFQIMSLHCRSTVGIPRTVDSPEPARASVLSVHARGCRELATRTTSTTRGDPGIHGVRRARPRAVSLRACVLRRVLHAAVQTDSAAECRPTRIARGTEHSNGPYAVMQQRLGIVGMPPSMLSA